MKVYTIERTQTLHTTISKAWFFFSNPDNLCLITPDYMNFKILFRSAEDKIYEGQMIHYSICVLPGLPVNWLTEITRVREPHYFVDEQRKGPYKLWQHQHHFKEVKDGVEMKDVVNYVIPFGFVGRLANALFVEKRVNAIFDYRFKALEEFFKDDKTKTRKSA
jgi:ligand-binding SRPBCC domain-containing protein